MDILVAILLIGGLVFFTAGSIGILRLPDFYTRLHAAGKLDTAGQLLTLSAVALYVLQEFNLDHFLLATKIVLIILIVHVTSPTATHAIVDAGVRAGLKPWKRNKPT